MFKLFNIICQYTPLGHLMNILDEKDDVCGSTGTERMVFPVPRHGDTTASEGLDRAGRNVYTHGPMLPHI